jgi:hypothetical protein
MTRALTTYFLTIFLISSCEYLASLASSKVFTDESQFGVDELDDEGKLGYSLYWNSIFIFILAPTLPVTIRTPDVNTGSGSLPQVASFCHHKDKKSKRRFINIPGKSFTIDGLPPLPPFSAIPFSKKQHVNDSVAASSYGSLLDNMSNVFTVISDRMPLNHKSSTSTLQTTDSSILSESSPHLLLTFSIEQISYSVKIYYAREFDTLRRNCGLQDSFVESLSRCTSFSPSGGKSASSFFLTNDNRYVIKQMMSKWNIDEKESLLETSPAYFEYLSKSSSNPTALAKILGFFTVSWSRKLPDGSEEKYEMDLLVMEHLFYNCTISECYDLKGISDRQKVKGGESGGTTHDTDQTDTEECAKKDVPTLWDGEWIQNREMQKYLLHPHSRYILLSSIKNDVEFLDKANIMDYSLLVGVDEKSKKLVVGIVDFIGHYTIFKKLESGVKGTVKGVVQGAGGKGKDVTTIAPDKYRERFYRAMQRYFVASPGKFLSNFDFS